MSECDLYCTVIAKRNAEFYTDDFEHHHLYVNRPRIVEYIPRVKRSGERRYTILCHTDSEAHAFSVLAEAMQDFQWKRGDVLASEGPMSYYEPRVIVEMKR